LARKSRPSIRRRILRYVLKTLFVLWVFTILQVVLLRFINPPFTAMTLWKWIKKGDLVPDYRLYNSWRPLKEISPHIRRAVLAGDDQRFLSHHGFDFTEMNKAVKDMVFKKEYRGASTITMQSARTVFLWPGRTFLRKIAEAYYTVLIEIFWGKERILEIYLNTVDWGKDILGVEAASKRYFHRSSSSISASQAALLAAILPNPHNWSPVHPNSVVLTRKKRILKDMKSMPLIP
jgi:monofunctional biosynthetic peptidoglycan transglycosylase